MLTMSVCANLKRDNDRKQGKIITIGSTCLTKSTLPKSMQPSIYPLGRCLTFSTSQVYTAESIRAALPMIFTTAVMIINTLW